MTETDLPPAPLATFGFIAVGAVLLAAAGVFVATNRWSSAGGTTSNLVVATGELETLKVIQDQVRRDVEERNRLNRALTVTQADALLHKVHSARQALQEADTAFQEWANVVPKLLTSEGGSRVASRRPQLEVFADIYNRAERPTPGSTQAVQDRLATLEQELHRLKDSQDALLPPGGAEELERRVDNEARNAERIRDAVARDLNGLKAIVAATSEAPPAATTLEEALTALAREQAEARAKLISEAVRQVREEQNHLDATMRREKAEEIAVEERRLERAKLDDQKMRIAAEANFAETKTRQDELRLRAESAVVQDNYAPFLGLGKTQPVNQAPDGPAQHSTWVPSGNGIDKVPASLDALRRARALTRFEVFVQLATSSTNDRKPWAALTEERTEEYRRRFDEFKELAPLWVEMKLLGN